MNMPGLDVIFAGSGEFGLPTLRALLAAGHRLVMVVSQPDKPAGRGKKLTPTAIAQFAIEHPLPLIRTTNLNSETLPPADVMVVIAFGQKIAPHIVDHPRLGSVNLHASLLPKYRGAAPINWAILRGETVTGNSIIRLVQKMDAGAVLGQSELTIGELETAGEVHDRLAEAGAPLMLDVLRKLADGTVEEKPQNDAEATLAPKLNREVAHIDWSRSARDISCQIRGLFPWPGCRVRLVNAEGHDCGHLTLARARAAGPTGALPGVIDAAGLVGAGHQAVEIVEVQPEGKRPMSLAAYRNGHPWETGMRLESL